MTLSGMLSGSGGLTKTGVGGAFLNSNNLTVTLSGNTYSGPTSILGSATFGDIIISAANNLGNGSATNNIILAGGLQTSGTFDLGVNRTITLVSAGGTPQIQSNSGTLTVSGTIDDTANAGWAVSGVGNVNS